MASLALLLFAVVQTTTAQSPPTSIMVIVNGIRTSTVEIDAGTIEAGSKVGLVGGGRYDGGEKKVMFESRGFTCVNVDNPVYADPDLRLWRCTKARNGRISVWGGGSFQVNNGPVQQFNRPGTHISVTRLNSVLGTPFCDNIANNFVTFSADTIRYRDSNGARGTETGGTYRVNASAICAP